VARAVTTPLNSGVEYRPARFKKCCQGSNLSQSQKDKPRNFSLQSLLFAVHEFSPPTPVGPETTAGEPLSYSEGISSESPEGTVRGAGASRFFQRLIVSRNRNVNRVAALVVN